jgi:hypothetical protein
VEQARLAMMGFYFMLTNEKNMEKTIKIRDTRRNRWITFCRGREKETPLAP